MVQVLVYVIVPCAEIALQKEVARKDLSVLINTAVLYHGAFRQQ